MTWGFDITLKSWPTSWPWGNLPERLRPQSPLYSTAFCEVYVSEETQHQDGSVSPWQLVVASPWFYFVFVDKEQLRKAVACLEHVLR